MPKAAPNDAPTITSPALAAAVEAILFSLDRPASLSRIAAAAGHGEPGVGEARVKEAIDRLNDEYAASARAFRIEHVAGGWRVMTLPEHAPVVEAFHRERETAKLSRAAVETLAIVAYRQPITRVQLETIRGCACGEVLKSLIDRRLVTIKGRAEELGRPMLYGTTREFLEVFGLSEIKDLPPANEMLSSL